MSHHCKRCRGNYDSEYMKERNGRYLCRWCQQGLTRSTDAPPVDIEQLREDARVMATKLLVTGLPGDYRPELCDIIRRHAIEPGITPEKDPA